MYEKEFVQAAEPKEDRMEQTIEERNLFTVVDENMPFPEGIQSEKTIILPEIQSMPAYVSIMRMRSSGSAHRRLSTQN